MLDPYVNTPVGHLIRALQVTGRRLVVEDIPEDAGNHIYHPAAGLGSKGMSSAEFIRRIRRYALAHDLARRTEYTDLRDDDSEDARFLLRAGDWVVDLPDEPELGAESVTSMLNALGIDERQF